MWNLIHKNHSSTSSARQLAEMHQKLIGIGEKERILRERSADREAYRYLLDAHRLFAYGRPVRDHILSMSPPETGESNHMVA
jgi:hypothetical protein